MADEEIEALEMAAIGGIVQGGPAAKSILGVYQMSQLVLIDEK